MSFLAPLAWLGAALALPVILFYLVRDEPRRRIVSNFLLWAGHKAAVHESARWRKLRRIFSLLLQLLFLVLVLAALSRPVLPWADAERAGVVFVVDTSASMAATDESPSRAVVARSRLRDAIGALGSGDEAALLTTDPEILVGWTRNRQELRRAAEGYREGVVARDPRPALALATSLAAGRSGRVVFFTDGVWDRVLDPAEFPGVAFSKVGEEAPNAGITLFAARRSEATAVALTARVQRSARSDASPLKFLFKRNGELLDAREIALPAGGSWRGDWELQLENGADLEASVSGPGEDLLPVDNTFAFSVGPLRPVDVVLVSPPDRFIEAALEAIPGVNTTRIWPADGIRFGDPDKLWIFKGAVPPADFRFAGLVLIAPNESGFFGELRGEMSDPWISEWEAADPVTRFTGLGRVRATRALDILPPEGTTVFAASAGRPLIFGNWKSSPRWLVIGIDMERSDLVLRAAFPVLLANLVEGMRESQPLAAVGPDSVVTALHSNLPEDGKESVEAFRPASPLDWPLGNWFLLAAVLWVFVEWWTYHRRITE